MEVGSILRDYVVKFSISEPIPTPSTDWVKKIGVVVKPKSGGSVSEGEYLISTRSQIAEYTNLTTPQRILDAGSISFYLIVVEELANIEKVYHTGKYYTMLFSEDFTDQEVIQYKTTTGFSFFDGLFAKTFGRDEDKANTWLDQAKVMSDFICYGTNLNSDQSTYNYDNLYYALGSLLSLDTLDNRQYIELPVSDNIIDLADADNLFNDRISLSTSDVDYGNRLSGFFVGGQPIIAPYVDKLLQLDLQAAAVTVTNLYKPNMTVSALAKVKDYLYQKVILKYINPDIIPNITLTLEANDEGWTAKGKITLSSIKALWRYLIEIRKEG